MTLGEKVTQTNKVTVTVPAHPSRIRLLRLIAGQMVADSSFTIEDINDLYLCTEEASSFLTADFNENDLVTATFEVEEFSIKVTLVSEKSYDGDKTGFAWAILTSLADETNIIDKNTLEFVKYSSITGVEK